MDLPLLIERLSNDPLCDSFGYLTTQLHHTDVPAEKIADRITELTELRSIIDNAIKDYTDDACERMCEGHEIAGMKIKNGAKRRTIPDETRAVGYLCNLGIPSDALYVRKLVGVPAIEKLLADEGHTKKEITEVLENFVDTTIGAPSATFA